MSNCDENSNNPKKSIEEMLESYVGYGSPPKHSQFQKGKSGNPKGRPPNKALHLIIDQVLNETVTIQVNGKKVEMTKKEAFIQQLMNESMKGKSAATKNLIYLLKNLTNIFPI